MKKIIKLITTICLTIIMGVLPVMAATSTVAVENNGALGSWIGSGTYTNDKRVTLNGTAAKNTFQGWYLQNSKIGNNNLLTATVNSDAVYVPDREWDIVYNLNGGTHGTTHPEKYARATAAFAISNPTKGTIYDFVGWEGTGLSEPTPNLQIQSGSTGDRSYTAKWMEYGTLTITGGGYIQSIKSYKTDKTLIEEKTLNSGGGYSLYTTNNVIHYQPGGKIVFQHPSGYRWYYGGNSIGYSGNPDCTLTVPTGASGAATLYVYDVYDSGGNDSFYPSNSASTGWARLSGSNGGLLTMGSFVLGDTHNN